MVRQRDAEVVLGGPITTRIRRFEKAPGRRRESRRPRIASTASPRRVDGAAVSHRWRRRVAPMASGAARTPSPRLSSHAGHNQIDQIQTFDRRRRDEDGNKGIAAGLYSRFYDWLCVQNPAAQLVSEDDVRTACRKIVRGGVEINQCVGCTRQCFAKSFLGDEIAS